MPFILKVMRESHPNPFTYSFCSAKAPVKFLYISDVEVGLQIILKAFQGRQRAAVLLEKKSEKNT